MKGLLSFVVFLLTSATLVTCKSGTSYSPIVRSEPEAGALITRVPRTLRLYYEDLPIVDRSAIRLIGPGGEHQLRGLHTMSADDLMIEIIDPVTLGVYTVEWTTVIADDPNIYSGKFSFTVTE